MSKAKRLWSLYDVMLPFNPSPIVEAVALQARMQAAITVGQEVRYGFALDLQGLHSLRTTAEALLEQCKQMSLTLTEISVREFLAALDDILKHRGRFYPPNPSHPPPSSPFITFQLDAATAEQLRYRIKEISGRLKDELATPLFFSLSPNEATYLAASPFPYGDEVANKMPNAIEDISEASKCLGLGRFTACAFHVMRAMETGVRKFGDKVGVTLIDSRGKDKLWQNVLDEANRAIRALDQNNQLTKRYAAISSQLYNVKLAFRNEVMHPKETYTEEEARNVFDSAKAFMSDLASVL